jgi:hypothetical protein
MLNALRDILMALFGYPWRWSVKKICPNDLLPMGEGYGMLATCVLARLMAKMGSETFMCIFVYGKGSYNTTS